LSPAPTARKKIIMKHNGHHYPKGRRNENTITKMIIPTIILSAEVNI
jgi:hypothetical protein